jgi:hypothetical protein
MDTNDDMTKTVCTNIIQSTMRQLRWRFKKENWEKIKDMSPEEAYKMKPANVLERSWKDLVNRWFDAHYQVLEYTLTNTLHLHLCYA